MEFREVREEFKSGDTFTFYPISDIHFGTKACHKKKIYEVRNKIMNDPFARWIGIGDYIECIDPRDRRFDSRVIDPAVFHIDEMNRMGDASIKFLADFIRPIIDKCWGMSNGNHEESFEDKTATSIIPRVLDRLGAPEELYVGWTCSYHVTFSDQYKHTTDLRIWAEHGWQSGRTQGATRNEMHQVPGLRPRHKIYLRGHSHHLFADPITMIYQNDAGKYLSERVYVAHTGAYLESYSEGVVSYAERSGYPPLAIGGLSFSLSPNRNDVEVSVTV
jgi:hypothetical protein